MKPLKVGDLCVTVNTKYPAMNDGLLVVIVGINPRSQQATPYQIRRVDGQPFPLLGGMNWFRFTTAKCHRSKLKPIDAAGKDMRDQLVVSKPRRKKAPATA
jgi:hypothetical protein